MNDPTELRHLRGMAEENARQAKRQPVWDTRPPTVATDQNIVCEVSLLSHGLVVGDVIESTASALYTFSSVTKATISSTGPVGVVTKVYDVNGFQVGLRGQFFFDMTLFTPANIGFVNNVTFYLSATPGVVTQDLAALKTAGTRIRPLLTRLTSDTGVTATEVQVLIYGDELIGSLPSLQDMTDSAITSVTALADGDILTWKTATKNWINAQPAGLGSHAATSVIGRAPNSAGTPADIAATADNQALVRIGGTLQFAALPIAALANVAATTVLGNATAGSAAVTAIAAAADNTAMLRISGALVFAQIPNAALANSSLTITGTAPIVVGGSGALGGTTTVAVSDATTGAKGVVQLAGDLAGTAAAPVVGNNKIDFARLAQGFGYTIIGNPTSSTANNTGITAGADNQVLVRNGGALAFGNVPMVYANKHIYSSSGTFTVPAGVYCIFAIVTGAGGGSAGSSAAAAIFLGTCGAGGAAAGIGFIPVVPGQVLTITIGAPGAGGASGGSNGTNGGDSSITGSSPTVSLIAAGGGLAAPTAPGHGGLPQTSYSPGQWGVAGQNGMPLAFNGGGTTTVSGTSCITSLQFFRGYGGQPGAVGDSSTGAGAGGDGVSASSTAGNNGNAGAAAIFY